MMHRGLEVRGEVPVTCRPSRRTSHSYSNSGHCTRCSSMNCRSRGTRRPRRRHPLPSLIGSSPDRVGVFGRSTRLAAFRSGPVLPNMDAEHANGADVSESAAGLPGGHGRETRQTMESIIGTPGAVNLVTTHPPDSRHPRHGVQELLPTPAPTRLAIVPASRAQGALGDLQPSSPAHLSPKFTHTIGRRAQLTIND
jgi:hypothetical protein